MLITHATKSYALLTCMLFINTLVKINVNLKRLNSNDASILVIRAMYAKFRANFNLFLNSHWSDLTFFLPLKIRYNLISEMSDQWSQADKYIVLTRK